MQINNVTNNFNNASIQSKKNPQFGALKIDSEVFEKLPKYANDINLECLKKATEELKNTKFYDIHLGCIHSNILGRENVGILMNIVDKRGKTINDIIDQEIHIPAEVRTTMGDEQDWDYDIIDNSIIFTLYHICDGFHSKFFEVANNTEAKELMDRFLQARIKGKQNGDNLYGVLKNLDSYVKFLKIFEAAEQYKKTKYDKGVESFNKAFDYFQKNNLSDCICNTRKSTNIDEGELSDYMI